MNSKDKRIRQALKDTKLEFNYNFAKKKDLTIEQKADRDFYAFMGRDHLR